jgi:hypothetical protein
MKRCVALFASFLLIFLTRPAPAGPLDVIRSWLPGGHRDQPRQRVVHSKSVRHDKPNKGDKPDASASPNPDESPESAESPGPSPVAVQSPDAAKEDKQALDPDTSSKDLASKSSQVVPVAIDPPPLF